MKEKERQGLVEYPFAISPIVFVTHPSVQTVDNITTEQVREIYTGNIREWDKLGGPRHRLYAVTREANDSSRKILEQHLPVLKNRELKAKTFYTTPETVEAISTHKFTFGYIPLPEATRNQLNVLALNGVAPTGKNVTSGNYAINATFYIVSKGEAAGLAKEFIDFLYSDEAQRKIQEFGVIPANRS